MTENSTWRCAVAECDRPKTARARKGMCGHHYDRTLPPTPRRMRVCEVAECANVSGKRLCAKHMRLWRLAIASNPCAVDGCGKAVHALGWCEAHYSRFKRYAMRPEVFDALLESQGGRCAICGATEAESGYPLVVDHDHNCCVGRVKTCGECVRGILCKSCNVGIGNLKDDAPLVLAAYHYLAAFVS